MLYQSRLRIPVIIGRIVLALLLLVCIIALPVTGYIEYLDNKVSASEVIAKSLITLIFFSILIYMFLHSLITGHFKITTEPGKITIRNVITGKTYKYLINEVQGFSTSIEHYRVLPSFNQIIIYTQTGKKFILTSFVFKNFKGLSEAIKQTLPYLGFEHAKYTWTNKRIFKYDK